MRRQTHLWRETETIARKSWPPPRRAGNYRASDFRGTSSWQFQRLLEIKMQLVGERPLGVVRNRRFDRARLIVRIDIEKRRADEVTKIIDDHFLLLWLIV